MRSSRESTIVHLLERYVELTDPVRAGNGDGVTGLLLMPHEPSCAITRTSPARCSCALRSALELERLLRVMREDSTRPLLTMFGPRGEFIGKVSVRACWWHLNERYVRATSRTCWRCPKCGSLTHVERHQHRDRRGRVCGYPGRRVLELVYDRHVRSDVVERGVSWLDANWSNGVACDMPRELLVA